MRFEILTPDAPEWLSVFNALPQDQRDVFYHPGFAKLNQLTINRDHEVLCAALVLQDGGALYPFVKRNLGTLTGRLDCAGYYDITSLYGRGGIVSSWKNVEDGGEFHTAMDVYCSENKVICGFDRFHPVMENECFASPNEKIMEVGGFVVVDIRPELAEIEKSFKQSVRKDVRKAQRNTITCFSEANCDHLDVFLKIYRHTMTRNAAAEFYYFSTEYFRALQETMPGDFHFFYAQVDGNVVSCELVLHHGKYGHSFLGGTKREALPLGANPALKLEIIRVLKDLGCEYFLLGGGTQPNDGVFNFKKAYAPNGVYSSRIGCEIWDHDIYSALKNAYFLAEGGTTSSRFQFYDID